MEQIPGIIFRPCFMSEEAFEEGMRSTEFWTDKNFFNEYRKHIAALDIIADCAKVYITKMWKTVDDWSSLNVIIRDNSGKPTEYFNYVPRNKERKSNSKTWDDMMKRMDKADKKKHNPIVTFDEPVLDPTDGDFSIKLNGKYHLWIDNESIIIIAKYIEDKQPLPF